VLHDVHDPPLHDPLQPGGPSEQQPIEFAVHNPPEHEQGKVSKIESHPTCAS
jgi:hypothetical protein